MKRVRLRSMEDFENLPEGEWVEVVGGMNATFTYEGMEIEDGALVIRLPPGIRRQFRAGNQTNLKARISKGSLIVTKRARPRTRRRN